MNAHSNIGGTLSQELAQLDADLATAFSLANAFDAHKKTAEATFKDAVSEVYDAWSPKKKRLDLLRAFCDAKAIVWSDKKHPKNRFLPIVEYLFNIEQGKRTDVSYALAYACIQNVPIGGFKTWIDSKAVGGYRGAYAKYREHLNAQKTIGLSGGQAPWLNGMHSAVSLMRGLTRSITLSTADDAHPRQFLLRNAYNDSGQPEGILELVSTAATFTAARMVFEQPIAEIGARAYLFRDDTMSDFEAQFPTAAIWTATGHTDELLIVSDSGLIVRGEAISDLYDGLPLRGLAPFRLRTGKVTAQLAKMQEFDGWLKESKALARRQHAALTRYWPGASKWQLDQMDHHVMRARVRERMPSYRMPRALDFDGSALGFMSAYVPEGSAFRTRVHDLFDVPPASSFEAGAECQLHIKHAQRLCRVFASMRIEPSCSIAYAHEAESAFVCETGLPGGRFLVAYPTVLNPRGELRCLAENLNIAELLNSGIEVPPPPASTVASANPMAVPPAMFYASKFEAEQFAAYITSYRPVEEDRWQARKAVFLEQLEWWNANSEMPLHLMLSGWSEAEVNAFNVDTNQLLDVIEDNGGSYQIVPPATLLENRIACLKAFYETDACWGVMMDDDAILYDKPQHNSGPLLFAEMALNGSTAYAGVDVFFPINPAKAGFNSVYEKDRALYDSTHVFRRSGDLKGSLFVVRNFRKEGREPVLPPVEYGTKLHGEDTLFAVEALSQGYAVMRCENIILKEIAAPSHFDANGDRKPAMKHGNERLTELYQQYGLAMKPDSHLLERKGLYAATWGTKQKVVKVAKPSR